MTTTNCDHIRRELDEVMLEETFSPTVEAHLRSCPNCHEFNQKQRKLREIVGSLGTVEAPSDFDFRLRARLASEPSANSYHFWPVLKWGLTAVAAVILFVGGFSLMRQVTSSEPVTAEFSPPVVPEGSPVTKTPVTAGPKDPPQVAGFNPPEVPRIPRTTNGPRPRRTFATRDSSSVGASVISANTVASDDAVFSVDATRQSFTLSLDDGRGNARTISLPTVTFGSQRVLGTANQYAPKGVW